MKCVNCNNNNIIAERAELGYVTCIPCAEKAPKVRGNMIFDENLTPTLQIISGDQFENIKHFLEIDPNNITMTE